MRIFSSLATLILYTVLLSTAPDAAAVVFKIATLSPDGSTWMKLLRAGGEEVKNRTDGRVEFKFYPGGVMGNDQSVLRKIRSGQLHGAVLTAGGLTQTYGDIQLYNLPMAFDNLAEVDYVRSKMDSSLLEGLREQGYVGFGFAEVGFAYAMSKEPVRTLQDMRSQKVWTPAGDPGSELAIATFDISPIPLSIADVLSGLQTGLINGVAMPPVAAIALQWHTQLDYALDVPLLYVYGLLVVTNRQFDRLSPGDQEIFLEVMRDAVERVNAQSRTDHERSVEVLKIQGMTWNDPASGEVDRWEAISEDAAERLVEEGVLSAEMVETLRSHLVTYRAGLD
jgi:TRAP-type C4-dicarboxylate transport system substrate-binding protein